MNKLLLIKNTNLIFHFKGKINQKFIDALNIRLKVNINL